MITISNSTSTAHLPLVVHVGFAGSRQLRVGGAMDAQAARTFDEGVERYLVERLARLPSELGLGEPHRMCGVSQVAAGADTLFGRALVALKWPHRIFLPQPRDAFLSAVGSGGHRDFSDEDVRAALALLDGPNVVQERVVSTSAVRTERFLETNVAIARVCQVAVCLVRAEAQPKPGGTHHFRGRVLARGRPVLEILVSPGPGGQPLFEEHWHQRERFRPPGLPPGLEGVTWPPKETPAAPASEPAAQQAYLPPASRYGTALKKFASEQSEHHQGRFMRSALVILGAHLLATMLSVIALGYHDFLHGHAAWFVLPELGLLLLGLTVHRRLHHARGARSWAVSRLTAEVARSVLATGGMHAQLDYLFALPLPPNLRPLLKTLNVLHLNDTRRGLSPDWAARRDAYVKARLDAQLAYYRGKGGTALGGVRWLGRVFLTCSLLAVAAAAVELVWLLLDDPPPLLGVAAVMLPLLAVAALSFAAALDLEARAHVYEEMVGYLEEQAKHVAGAASEGEFVELALETEAHLLGETANWFARRAYVGVA